MKKVKGQIELNTLIQIHNENYEYFKKLWDEGETNEKYRRGDPWSEAEKTTITNQGRQVYSLGLVPQKLNTICAEQRKNRTSIKIEAKNDVNDEPKGELATLRAKDFETSNEFKYTESDIFDSGVGVKYGVGEFYVDVDRYGNNVIKFCELDYKDAIWDKNARTYTKRDGSFVAKFTKMYRWEIAQKYGKSKAKFLASETEFQFGREKAGYWVKFGPENDLDIITVVTHWQKVVRPVYKVFFDGNLVEENFSKKDAEKTLRMLNAPYVLGDVPLPSQEIIPDEKTCYDKYEFTYTDMLKYEQTDLEDYPLCFYQSFWFKDQVWCLTDILKYPQLFIDRVVSQIDYSFGLEVKNVNEINTSYLADGWDYNKVKQALIDGEPIPVIRNGAISPIPSTGANPQYMQMFGIMQQVLDDLGGGRSFAGLQDSAGESGIAIKEKKVQGQLIAALFIDNLSRWKNDVGMKLMWYLKKYDTAERVIKVHGGTLSPEMMQLLQSQGAYQQSVTEPNAGYVSMNKPGVPLTYLNDFEFELLVTESELSETQREQRFQELVLINSLFPGVVTPDIILEFSPIAYSLKQKIITNYMEQKQLAMQQMQLDNQTKQVNMASQIAGIQRDREAGENSVKPGDNKKQNKGK